MLEESSVETDQFADVMKLEFYPALQSSEIKPPMFGDLVAGTSYKPPSFALSVLRSRDCGHENTGNLSDEKKSTVSVDMATQTEDDCIHKENRINMFDVETDQNNNAYSSVCISESKSSCARITPPPGMNCQPVCGTFPSVNFMNPPPGFSAHAPVNNMQMNMQINPFLLGGNYRNTISPMYMKPLQVLSLSQPIQSQAPAIYKFGDNGSPFNFTFQAQQHSVPLSNSATNVSELQSLALEQNSHVRKIGENENLCVQTIPLPMGPAPESKVFCNKKNTDMSDDLFDPRNSFMSKNHDISKEQLGNEKDSPKKYFDTKSTNEQSPKEGVRAKGMFETVENTDGVQASYDIERQVVGMKVGLDESDIQHEKRNKSRLASELLHSVVKRKKALMLETKDNIDFIQRTDEAESAMEPSEIDQEDMNRQLKDLDANKILSTEIRSCGNQDEEPVPFVSNSLKESFNHRTRFFLSPSPKPLRKPFHLTDDLLNASKNINNSSFETNCIPTSEGNGDEIPELLLDISSPSVQTLSNSVSRNYPPTKKEVETRNKEVLLAQRSWFKDYMQQKQANIKRETKEDKENVSALTIKVKSEKVDLTDEKFAASCNNSDNATTEIKSSEEVNGIHKQVSDINPSPTGAERGFYEVKINMEDKKESDAGHTLNETEVTKLRDKEVDEQKETDKQKEIEKQKEEDQQNGVDKVAQSARKEAPETVATSNAVKDNEKMNDRGRKPGLQNITSSIKDYLGNCKSFFF